MCKQRAWGGGGGGAAAQIGQRTGKRYASFCANAHMERGAHSCSPSATQAALELVLTQMDLAALICSSSSSDKQ